MRAGEEPDGAAVEQIWVVWRAQHKGPGAVVDHGGGEGEQAAPAGAGDAAGDAGDAVVGLDVAVLDAVLVHCGSERGEVREARERDAPALGARGVEARAVPLPALIADLVGDGQVVGHALEAHCDLLDAHGVAHGLLAVEGGLVDEMARGKVEVVGALLALVVKVEDRVGGHDAVFGVLKLVHARKAGLCKEVVRVDWERKVLAHDAADLCKQAVALGHALGIAENVGLELERDRNKVEVLGRLGQRRAREPDRPAVLARQRQRGVVAHRRLGEVVLAVVEAVAGVVDQILGAVHPEVRLLLCKPHSETIGLWRRSGGDVDSDTGLCGDLDQRTFDLWRVVRRVALRKHGNERNKRQCSEKSCAHR
eukprot:comp17527_c0_seq1/m.29774 comp17527_c0_seq1/g.29774  ORF comp17527_c0_seq1/g.29774 comp17527_c0_seq1/m.29774 type:complete len:366 (-) comp17527_c0_seq1:11-1108(-)